MSEHESKKAFLGVLQRSLEFDRVRYKNTCECAEGFGYKKLAYSINYIISHIASTLADAEIAIDELQEDNTSVVAKGRSKQGGYEFEIYHHAGIASYSFRVFKDKECTKVLIDSKDINKEHYDHEGDAAEAVNAFFAGINLGK